MNPTRHIPTSLAGALLAVALTLAAVTAAHAAPRKASAPDPEADALRAELRDLQQASRAAQRREATIAKLRQRIADLKAQQGKQ